MNRRVVVTGMGLVSPFGDDVDLSWRKLLDGESCITKVESVDLSDSKVKIGGEIKWEKIGGWFDPYKYIPKGSLNRCSRSILYGIAASPIALLPAAQADTTAKLGPWQL